MEIQLLKPPACFSDRNSIAGLQNILTGKLIHYLPCSNRHFSICQQGNLLRGIVNCSGMAQSVVFPSVDLYSSPPTYAIIVFQKT